jgi:hypothetical protein
MATSREFIATLLNEAPSLKALGLEDNAVVQADTVDSPTMDMFIVLRWLDERPGMGAVTRRPFDLWIYDRPGDYDRVLRVGRQALLILDAVEQSPIEGGWITRIETKRDGLGRGSDMYDEGYERLVVPFRAMAIASGL